MWQFVIWAIATLVAYALQPKPPKQKPPSLEDFDIPTAEAGRPVPAVFGEVTVTGPNVIWYGDYEVQTETEDGIKRRFYKMGLHFAICYGPADELQKIIAGERVAWGDGNILSAENPQTTSGQIRILAPNLFGGEDKEGGISGYADVMMGEATQTANAYLTTVQGTPQPAYRGIMTLVFRKGMVTANSTYVKPWAFKIQRIKKGWYNDACWYPDKAAIPLIVGTVPAQTIDGEWTMYAGSAYRNMSVVYGTAANTYTATAQQLGENAIAARNAYYGESWTCDGTYYQYDSQIGLHLIVAWDSSYGYGRGIAAAEVVPTCPAGYSWQIIDTPPNLGPGVYDNPAILCNLDSSTRYSYDMNPAHIIYQAITDPAWGMGYPASCINEASFLAAADLFYSEGMGLSLMWNQQSKTEEFIQEILNHCGAILGVDPETGQFILTPLRGDYDVASLDLYDETKIVAVEQFERAGYGELVGEVSVVYRDKATNKDRTVTVQNLAVIQSQAGVVSETARYPGISHHALASRVAMRDLKARSVPLGRGKMRVDRNAWDIIPGGVFKLSWSKLGLSNVVCRVLEVNTGTLTDGTITVTFSEDVFGLGVSTYAVEQESGWSQPSFLAVAVSNQTLIETPYWWLTGALGSAETAALSATASYVYPLAQKPQDLAEGFDLWSRIDVGSPQNDFAKVHSNAEFVATAVLQSQESPEADISQSATTLYITSSTLEDFAVVGDLIQIGTGATAEIVRLTGGDLTTYITVTRGHLDTTPQIHAHNTLMWLLPQSDLVDETQYATGDIVDSKLLTITGSNILAIGDATEATITLAGRPYKPIPAGNVQINGEYWPTLVEAQGSPPVTTCTVTWSHRNRTTQTDTTLQTDTGITGEANVVYNLTAYDNDTEAVLDSVSGVTGTSWDASLSGTRNVRIELETARDAGGSPSTYITAWQRQVRYFNLSDPTLVDQYWSSVSLLMHMDDGSPIWVDSSPIGHTVNPSGNVQISNAQSVFGGSSALFDGNGDYLTINDHTSFNFGSGDFTIEFRYRTASVAASTSVIERRSSFTAQGFSVRLDTVDPTKMNFVCGDSNISAWEVNIKGTTTLSANTWYAVAITRSGSSFKLFIDGNVDGSATWAGTIATSGAANVLIGIYYDGSGDFNGYIDELRITKGVARYTTTYTPSSSPFPETA